MTRFPNKPHAPDPTLVREVRDLQRSANATLRTAEGLLAAAVKSNLLLARIDQRQLTSRKIQTTVWEIWGRVRLHKDSLDSQRQCRQIQQLVEAAVADEAQRAEDLAAELAAARLQIAELKKGDARACRIVRRAAHGPEDEPDTEVEDEDQLPGNETETEDEP